MIKNLILHSDSQWEKKRQASSRNDLIKVIWYYNSININNLYSQNVNLYYL